MPELYLYENHRTPETLSFTQSGGVPALQIRTCQRALVISVNPIQNINGVDQRFEGTEAYEFLLRFASGLESEIKGETDVFGQIKLALRTFLAENESATPIYQPLFLRLFEDTKEIRSNYLQGLGGNTYGALSRRVMPASDSTEVLILGAGQISKSVAPYYAHAKLCIFNRTEARLNELKAELVAKGHLNIKFTHDETTLIEQIKRADQIIIATPPGSELDHLVIVHAKSSSTLLHLGGQERELGHFSKSTLKLISLTELFSLDAEQNLLRDQQIKRALDACHSRAILRSLSKSIHIPHGWEDLALFY